MTEKRFFCLLLVLTCLHLSASQRDDRICTSVTVRSAADLLLLQNCTIVAGHVSLVLSQFTPDSLNAIKPLSVEEITDYLLVYRTNGLDTLERLFPKLLVIRGADLLYDQYAMVIYENRNLENVGLISLLRVVRGSVRVESNPTLCYATTIDWVSILGQSSRDYHYILKNNKPSNFCPLCYNIAAPINQTLKHCWSLGMLQRQPLDEYNDQCPTECPSKKCNRKGKCCSSNCLTSCSDDNCKYCTKLISGKKCVNNCLPPYVMAFKRQCVLDCHRYGLVRLGGECVEKCPKLYREVKQYDIVTSCSLNCSGNFTIRSSKDLKGFSDCTILRGSLTLELTNMNKTKINVFYNELSYLREITGYLKITKSSQLVSLNFLRNLHTIGGAFLIDNTYALYVVDNYHLQDFWNENQKVSILKGRIFVHLNPHLCYKKILQLTSQIKESNFSIMDASPNSNGERAVCESRTRALNVTIDEVNANEARIIMDYLSPSELEPHLGYTFYYKESSDNNISKFDGRHACGHDDWYVETIVTKQRRFVLKNLNPYTHYALFVKTFVIIEYVFDFEAMSEMRYFHTYPAKPGPVQKIFYKSIAATAIEINWWPPIHPNGNLEKYLLRYQAVTSNYTTEPSSTEQQRKSDTCTCPKLEAKVMAPLPVDTDYYQREYLVYETALLTFILVKPESHGNNTMTEEMREQSKLAYERHHEELNNASRRTQDAGADDEFYIAPVLPACTITNPSLVFKKENNCTDLEEFDSNYELAGDRHTFTLKQLLPQVTYRIGLRACVEGLDNGCGAETVLFAGTVSVKLDNFLQGLKMSANMSK